MSNAKIGQADQQHPIPRLGERQASLKAGNEIIVDGLFEKKRRCQFKRRHNRDQRPTAMITTPPVGAACSPASASSGCRVVRLA